jgi:Lipocalin-like domain
MKRLLLCVLFGSLAIWTINATAQTATRKPIEGVWKVVEIIVTGDGASTTSNPQPSLFLFTRGYYTQIGVSGDKARALYKAESPTDAEKLTAFDSFFANAGTYEIAGTTLTIHPMVARNPNFMAGGFERFQFKIDGSNLWLTTKSSDISFRIGQRVVPSTDPPSETRTKFVRVE